MIRGVAMGSLQVSFVYLQTLKPLTSDFLLSLSKRGD